MIAALAFGILLAAAAAPAADGGPAYPLEPHKPIYAVHGYDWAHHADRLPAETKFQVSLKKRLFDSLPLTVAYSQKAFWQITDESGSRPFRETDHNPELFYELETAWLRQHQARLFVGFEHESNGQSALLSRSWNRGSLSAEWAPGAAGGPRLSLKRWERFTEPRKTSPTDATGDDNPAIESYLGRFELRLTAPLARDAAGSIRREFRLLLRKGVLDDTGTWLAEVFLQPPGFSRGTYVYAQAFYGYGESLIDYDRRVQSLGVGFAFR
ncbi:MAG: phospholipase A [Candidatus Lambdaproteobacteria bacterium]|nr:phospholipase A [Candidatus Lambdaproteobacteria bacterium]